MYEPTAIPQAFSASARGWLAQQFRRVADALAAPDVLRIHFTETNTAPERYSDGDLFLADGTNWNPGAGAGLYLRIGGAWVKIS